MKIGMNMLLWTSHLEESHAPILRNIKEAGFDGVEVPVFDVSNSKHFRDLAAMLDDIGLKRTVVAIIPSESCSPIASETAARGRAIDHLLRVVECTANLGGELIAGPWFQPLGVFSGERPSEIELEHCAQVHRAVLPAFRDANIKAGLEPLNRFEAHLLNTCGQAIEYASRIGEGGIGILYDTFHAHIEEQHPIDALRSLHAAGILSHVHISENDRGVPGRGHAKIRETIQELQSLGYSDWLTIEAFGRGIPDLAAATRVWRDFFSNPDEVYREGITFIRDCMAQD